MARLSSHWEIAKGWRGGGSCRVRQILPSRPHVLPHTPQYTLPAAYPQEIETLLSLFVLEVRLQFLVRKVRVGFWGFQCHYCGSTVTGSELT